jgi:hypothetical protein
VYTLFDEMGNWGIVCGNCISHILNHRYPVLMQFC